MVEIRTLLTVINLLTGHHRRTRSRRGGRCDSGYSTEAVIVTALLVAMAIAVLAVLTTKVLARARTIDLGP